MRRKVRPIRIEGDIAFIPLTQGDEAVIDAADVPLVEGHNWRVHRNEGGIYAKTQSRDNAGSRIVLMLHGLLTGLPMTDHRDGNGLNNRRKNLRPATRAQNNRNARMQKNNTTGLKGVSPTASGRWRARIAVDGKQIGLGVFDTPEDAHLAYCAASERLHGEFGRVK